MLECSILTRYYPRYRCAEIRAVVSDHDSNGGRRKSSLKSSGGVQNVSRCGGTPWDSQPPPVAGHGVPVLISFIPCRSATLALHCHLQASLHVLKRVLALVVSFALPKLQPGLVGWTDRPLICFNAATLVLPTVIYHHYTHHFLCSGFPFNTAQTLSTSLP